MANQYWLQREGKMYDPYSGGNKRFPRPPVLTILALVVLGLTGVVFPPIIEESVADTLGGQPALDIRPAKNVDEKLFLLRMLEDLYQQIPSANASAQATQTKLGQLRHFAKKVHVYVEKRKLDDSLATLFGDYIGAVDAYSDFLANIGRIERDAVAQAERDAMKTGFDAGFKGGSAAAIANNQGYSNGDSAAIGILAAIISAVADSYQKDQQLQEVKREAVRRAARDVQDKLSTFQARAELTATELTSKNSWKKGEAGFDEEKEDEELQRLSANRNWKDYWKIQNRRGERRPRDPFTKAFLARSCVPYYQSKGKIADMVYYARECVQSARLVPAGDIYDPYRLRFLRSAGDIANGAFSTELSKKGFFGGNKNAAAAYAVQVWDACLKYGRDPTGDIRERRAWALGASGNIKDAVKQATEVSQLRSKTLRYAYNYACLLSASGDTKTAFSWFSYAVENLGYSNIATAKTDPDLAAMRRAKQKEFNDLVTVKYTWSFNWGVFNDDIILSNDSAFTITNVVLSADIAQGSKKWNPVLKVNRVAPGTSYKWVNVVSIPDRKTDKATASLLCDQNR